MKKLIVKISSEIYIKSKKIKFLFIKKLYKNIINILKINFLLNNNIKIKYLFNSIEIYIKKNINYIPIINLLRKVPGISYIIIIKEYFLKKISLYKIYILLKKNYKLEKIKNKTFCIILKKKVNLNFSSITLKRFLGYLICKKINNSKVKLYKPNIKIILELYNNKLLFINKIYKGINGFPVGTQGTLLSLISGGYDSTLSTYLMLNKGCKIHFCYFDLLNSNYKDYLKVINTAHYLYNLLAPNCYKCKFYIINLSNIINLIIKQNINNNYTSIIIKYFMFKISKIIKKIYKYDAILTGESLGQVSSQTINNLNLLNINKLLIIRPLISYDKLYILNLLRKLNLYNLCNNIPEYCGFYSYKATANGNKYIFKKKISLLKNKDIINIIIKNIKIIYLIPNKKSFIKKKKKKICIIDNLNIKNSCLIDITINGFYKNNKKYKNYKILHIKYLILYKYYKKILLLSYKKKIIILCTNNNIQDFYINQMLKKNIINIYKFKIL